MHKEKVSDAIDTEVMRGHTAGPFSFPPFPVTHCSPLGAVKKASSDKVRLILDLSQPKGISVNEGAWMSTAMLNIPRLMKLSLSRGPVAWAA